jgi:hypothetical protein
MDRRLQLRYVKLVKSQMSASARTAAGPVKLPQTAQAAAATQAAWRFYNNERVSLAALAEPLREAGRLGAGASASDFILLAYDWSKLDYGAHESKTDRLQRTHQHDLGYDLTCALLVDAHSGAPLAPMELHLKTAQTVQSTSDFPPLVTDQHLDQLQPMMERAERWQLGKRVVHLVDREADSLGHYRRWHAAGHLFLVRGDDRRVLHNGQSCLISQLVRDCEQNGRFREIRAVQHRGKKARQQVAELPVTLHKPHKTRIQGRQREIVGPPLDLRLVISQVRDEQGKLLATWTLLTNVPVELADAGQIALWYYWRWRIESFYKLLKSHGQEVEAWQQESGEAIARRLLVAAMACVVVWTLERETSPQAEEIKKVLVRLSGRQMKHKVTATAPALLAGYFVLLSITDLLESTNYQLEDLKSVAAKSLPFLTPGGKNV